MSFFGFDASLPRDRPHDQSAHGFGQAPDAFAGLSSKDYDDDDDDALDFEDTYEGYDGLGDQLEETGDDFNDATFGSAPVGKDFDFSAQIANLGSSRQPLQQQQQQQQQSFRQQPLQPQQQRLQPPQPQYQSQTQQYRQPQAPPVPAPSTRPAKSGYEKYKEPDYIPKLEASASIWGPQTTQRPPSSARQQQQDQPMSIANVTKKMMSLDEVEAMMRGQRTGPSPQPPQQMTTQAPLQQQQALGLSSQNLLQQQQQSLQTRDMPQPNASDNKYMQPDPTYRARPQTSQIMQQLQPVQAQAHDEQRQRTPLQAIPASQHPQIATMHSVGPPQQSRPPPQAAPIHQPQMPMIHSRGPSLNGRPITHPEQLLQMSENDRAAYLAEDAKRAKRNHKIHLLSKDNGLMTPQDKNFITRIQLQQLLTATGNVDEAGPEAALAEDFYFQVYSQIRGPRANQPLNQFAQTYLHQTGGRTGNRRGFTRGGDQIRRMEQQVQRAVEAAKLKPKNKQLVIEGSLGKISFSDAKTPKPLLSLKRAEANKKRPASAAEARTETVASRKETLKNIEGLYMTLMRMEDHERNMPPPTTEDSSADEIQEQIDWRARIQELNAALWTGLKVMEPIDQSKSTPHPFISILSHPKGKKVIPRVFRQIDDQQRLTILTMIIIHLDTLDVVRLAQPRSEDELVPIEVRSEIELFSQAVVPILFNYIDNASLGIIVGLLGLIIERVNVAVVVRSKIGLGLLTMFLSRSELLKHGGHVEAQDQQDFGSVYNLLFDAVEPVLQHIFTTPINQGDDIYVWQFLAALGTGASPDQQPRLVISVKDRVMDTVIQAKQLPEEMGRPRLDNVNLFMRAIGLDVELLG